MGLLESIAIAKAFGEYGICLSLYQSQSVLLSNGE